MFPFPKIEGGAGIASETLIPYFVSSRESPWLSAWDQTGSENVSFIRFSICFICRSVPAPSQERRHGITYVCETLTYCGNVRKHRDCRREVTRCLSSGQRP